jgi:hypothetical protein
VVSELDSRSKVCGFESCLVKHTRGKIGKRSIWKLQKTKVAKWGTTTKLKKRYGGNRPKSISFWTTKYFFVYIPDYNFTLLVPLVNNFLLNFFCRSQKRKLFLLHRIPLLILLQIFSLANIFVLKNKCCAGVNPIK